MIYTNQIKGVNKMKKTNVYTIDDADLVIVLAEFNVKELEVIERFNESIRKHLHNIKQVNK